jgi:PhnB protein
MATHLNPYLNFNGRCREAMTFYQQCLGGELTMQKIGESAFAVQMPSEAGANILHSSLSKDGIVLMMGSDRIGESLRPGNSIALCLKCSTDEEMNRFFTSLSAGGQVKMPLHQGFWGSTYGELTDKFGILWTFIQTKN